MTLTIPLPILDRIIAECEQRLPHEACGLLGAPMDNSSLVQCVASAPNHSPTPQNSFFIDPHKQWQIEMAFERSGVQPIGSYHSHPTRDAQPSGTDCEFMGDRIMLIVGFGVHPDCRPEVKAWHSVNGQAEEVKFKILTPEELVA